MKLKVDQSNPDYESFFKLLVEVSKMEEGAEFNEDRNKYEWDKQLTQSWEKLVETAEDRN